MSAESIIILLIVLLLVAVFVRNVLYPMLLDYYFKRDDFLAVKARVMLHIEECNQLNEHIEHLKFSYADVGSFDYGKAQLVDTSLYNMNRPQWIAETRDKRTHLCSSSIATSARNQPYKYFCKYFNVQPNEESLERFEQVLNNFSAVEQGKYLLANERDAIVSSVSNSIPSFILNHHRDRVTKELGFQKISLSDIYFPVYTFKYISAAGKSSFNTPIKLDIQWIEGFIGYLASLVKFRNSVAGQRSLMTVKLREKIKERDNYTCQICTLSTSDEANLLLEIDHIIPLSKGGITSEDNLQTLCWKCNRSKGSKIYTPDTEVIINPVPTIANERSPTIAGAQINNSDRMKVERELSSITNKPDTTRPPKASAPNGSTKLDMTRPPKVRAPNSSAKLDMIPPLKASAPNGSTKLDMTRPPKVRAPNSSAKLDMTRPQANALRSAKDYLEYSGYSRKGLIEQLHECDDYIVSDATVAVDSLNIDWKEQAVKSAKDYLEYSGYSCKGLIEQLHECDDYSLSEATYGAEQAGACS